MRWKPGASTGGKGRSRHRPGRFVPCMTVWLGSRTRPATRRTASSRTLRRDAEKTAGRFPSTWPDGLPMAPEFRMLKGILDFLKNPDLVRTNANKTFAANELTRSREFFDTVEARPLTDEQRRAVVVDEGRNLVVAAAGSGKTSVIVAKAGWLVRRGYRRPSELLLLAFAKDARKELEERVRRRLGKETAQGMTVRTFHSLGMSIIGEAEGRRPTLAKAAEDDKALLDLLKRMVADLLADRKFSGILLRWFQDRFAPYKSEHEFRTLGEYWDYIRRHEIRSLKGEMVKSFEECEIANFLYLNGVPYEYERAYEHDTATPEKRQYQPDFYLPDAGIYIEHFALQHIGEYPSLHRPGRVSPVQGLEAAAPRRTRHRPHRDLQPRTRRGHADPEPGREAWRPWRHPVSDPTRRHLRRPGRTGPDRPVHSPGGDLSSALQGVPAFFPRSGATGRHGRRPPAGGGVPVRVHADLRALPGNPRRTGTDRLPTT